jgi:hypothetical protein
MAKLCKHTAPATSIIGIDTKNKGATIAKNSISAFDSLIDSIKPGGLAGGG